MVFLGPAPPVASHLLHCKSQTSHCGWWDPPGSSATRLPLWCCLLPLLSYPVFPDCFPYPSWAIPGFPPPPGLCQKCRWPHGLLSSSSGLSSQSILPGDLLLIRNYNVFPPEATVSLLTSFSLSALIIICCSICFYLLNVSSAGSMIVAVLFRAVSVSSNLSNSSCSICIY